jgi:hypothetical protein
MEAPHSVSDIYVREWLIPNICDIMNEQLRKSSVTTFEVLNNGLKIQPSEM